jgi:hypothetical protein
MNKWDRKKIDKHGEDEENETWKKCVDERDAVH